MAIEHTPRLGLTQWTDPELLDPVHPDQFNADAAALDDLAAIAMQGTAAARPAPGVRGRLYYATDTGALTYDTGAAWVSIPGRYAYSLGSTGLSNTAVGWETVVAGGADNTASNDGATVGGGLSNTSSGLYSTVSGGQNNSATEESAAVIGGYNNTAAFSYSSVLGGWGNKANADYAQVGGQAAEAKFRYERAFGSNLGKVNRRFILGRTTTSEVTTSMSAHGNAEFTASNGPVMDDGVGWVFDGLVIARAYNGSDAAGFHIRGVIKRGTGAASVAFVGTPVVEVLGQDDPAWNVALVADTAVGGLRVDVTGNVGDSISWACDLNVIEAK